MLWRQRHPAKRKKATTPVINSSLCKSFFPSLQFSLAFDFSLSLLRCVLSFVDVEKDIRLLYIAQLVLKPSLLFSFGHVYVKLMIYIY